MGLREVTKHLKLNQLKCIIISPNMERIQSKGTCVFRYAYSQLQCMMSRRPFLSYVSFMAALCNMAGHIYFHPVVSSSSFFFFLT